MREETDKIHVTPLGQHWEIGKPLAHEDDKCEAVKTARALAQEQGIETVTVHEGDGIIEQVADASVEAPDV